jgi:hypothetical protein
MGSEASTRRPFGSVGPAGITFLQPHNPNVVAWWSAAFPGFGHLLIHRYVPGVLLTMSEVIINTLGHVNEAMVYSFCGQFELAKQIVNPEYMYGYMAMYFWSICDSRRSANEMCRLSEVAAIGRTGAGRSYRLSMWGIDYLARRRPALGALCSGIFPGLGQLYSGRLFLAFYAIFWWWIYAVNSNVYLVVLELFHGRVAGTTAMLAPHWLLFMPSVMGGAIYHGHYAARENNRFFRAEQRRYLEAHYQSPTFRLTSGKPDSGVE